MKQIAKWINEILVDKKKPRAAGTIEKADFSGLEIEDKFVFGYGLDMDEYYRNLPFIATVDLERYTPIEGD